MSRNSGEPTAVTLKASLVTGSGLESERITVRQLIPGEEDEVAQALLHAYESVYDISDEYRERILDVRARVTENEVWVARDKLGDSLLGSFVTRKPDAEPLLDHTRPEEFDFKLLGVSPESRGQGIGRFLVETIIDIARSRGFSRVVLNSVDYMTPAHRLYERLGFERLVERARVKEDGTVVYVFGRDI